MVATEVVFESGMKNNIIYVNNKYDWLPTAR